MLRVSRVFGIGVVAAMLMQAQAHQEDDEGPVVWQILDGVTMQRQFGQTLELPQRQQISKLAQHISVKVHHRAVSERSDLSGRQGAE